MPRFYRILILSLLCIYTIAFAAQAVNIDAPKNATNSMIRDEARFFEVSPMIVPADIETKVVIKPLYDHVRPKDGAKYEAVYAPADQIAIKSGWKDKKPFELPVENGNYVLTQYFEDEQEHTLLVEEILKDKRRTIGEFHLYSLKEDLFALRPFKGDIHMHSTRSDGKEAPAYVPGASRRVGFDFMTLTDHHTYEGSLDSQKAYEGVPIDLRIYNGEEVHAPGNPVHIVSFGATEGIAPHYKKDEAKYRAEVEEIQKGLKDLPAGVDPFVYASCIWVANKIREFNGLSMFAHAYWFPDRRNYVSEPIRNALLKNGVLEALELISGMGYDSNLAHDTNALQVARYYEERANGLQIPVCGVSDEHGCETSPSFGKHYTVVFAPTSDLADLHAAIRAQRCVAVEASGDHFPRSFGLLRYVNFTHFLLREVFPMHDQMCFEEGNLMLRHIAGEASMVDRLRLCQGQIKAYYEKLWKK